MWDVPNTNREELSRPSTEYGQNISADYRKIKEGKGGGGRDIN
jgi:hypothetical protein